MSRLFPVDEDKWSEARLPNAAALSESHRPSRLFSHFLEDRRRKKPKGQAEKTSDLPDDPFADQPDEDLSDDGSAPTDDLVDDQIDRFPSQADELIADEDSAKQDRSGELGGEQAPGTTGDLFAELPGDEPPEDALALRIDNKLSSDVWNGTTFEDRMAHAREEMTRGLLQQMERSLVAQENYDDFEARMMKHWGLDTPDATPRGALRDLNTRVLAENRIAWNRASLAAQGDDTDTALAYSSRLEPPDGKGHGTTAGCAWNHGRLEPDCKPDFTLPRHWGCQCQALRIPDLKLRPLQDLGRVGIRAVVPFR